MGTALGTIIFGLLDPLSVIAVVAIISFGTREWVIIPAAAAVYAVAGFIQLSLFATHSPEPTRMIFGFFSGLIVATIVYYIRKKRAERGVDD